MDALEYAYGEIGRDQATMGPVIRVISPVMAGQSHKEGRQLYYAYSAMAAVLPGWDAAANRQDSDLLDYEPTAPACGSLASRPHLASAIAEWSYCTRSRPVNYSL